MVRSLAYRTFQLRSWLRVGAVPLILQSTAPYLVFSEQYPFAENPNVSATIERNAGERHYLRYNYLISGIRLGQVLGQGGECQLVVPAWEGRPCFFAEKRFDRPPRFGHRALEVNAQERVEWLFLSKSTNEHDNHLIDMEDGCAMLEEKGRDCLCSNCNGGTWLDESTAVIEVRYALINPNYGIMTNLSLLPS